MNQEKSSILNSSIELVANYLSQKDVDSSDYNSPLFWGHLHALHNHHLVSSPQYRLLSDHFNYNKSAPHSLPFIPVSLFKEFSLKSIPDSDIYRTLRSSGTSGQTPSKIFLDKSNARHQQIALSTLFTHFTGLSRPNVLIIDIPSTASRDSSFTARKAGILGFSSLCRKSFYALNDDYSLNHDNIKLAIQSSQTLLVFGFTFIVYKYFLQHINSSCNFSQLDKVVLLHGGGWKKLSDISLSSSSFNELVKSKTSIDRVINYYGMVEQTGSLFFECPLGYMHTNYLASLIPRNVSTLLPDYTVGSHTRLAHVLSALPTSYPGFSLLTDDLISIPFEANNCPCGHKGLPFLIHGRLPSVETRGCSDTHE